MCVRETTATKRNELKSEVADSQTLLKRVQAIKAQKPNEIKRKKRNIQQPIACKRSTRLRRKQQEFELEQTKNPSE